MKAIYDIESIFNKKCVITLCILIEFGAHLCGQNLQVFLDSSSFLLAFSLVASQKMLLFIILPLLAQSMSYEIKATGGGIVKPGQDLELSLVVDKVWDRCRW